MNHNIVDIACEFIWIVYNRYYLCIFVNLGGFSWKTLNQSGNTVPSSELLAFTDAQQGNSAAAATG